MKQFVNGENWYDQYAIVTNCYYAEVEGEVWFAGVKQDEQLMIKMIPLFMLDTIEFGQSG